MGPALIAPDTELFLTGYLRAALATSGVSYAAGVVVSISAPDPLPPRLVVVRRDGGGRLDVIREVARFGIQVWAETDQDATNLAALVTGEVVACADGRPVVRAELLSGPSSVAEPNPDRRKRYATFELVVRCAPLS